MHCSSSISSSSAVVSLKSVDNSRLPFLPSLHCATEHMFIISLLSAGLFLHILRSSLNVILFFLPVSFYLYSCWLFLLPTALPLFRSVHGNCSLCAIPTGLPASRDTVPCIS